MRPRTRRASFWLADLSIGQPVFITMIALAVIVVGVVSYMRAPVDLYPDVSLPVVVVQTLYPGASPRDVEDSISKPIEDALYPLSGVDTIRSTSASGVSQVTVEFKMSQDPRAAADEVRARLSTVRDQLPADAREPIVETFDPSAAPVLSIAVADRAGTRSPAQLRSLVDDSLKPALEQIPGVGSVDVTGGLTPEIHVDVSASRLRDYHLSADRVVQAIRATNLSVPVGRIPDGTRDAQVETNGVVSSWAELADVPVSALPDGEVIRVRDVANVGVGYSDSQSLSRLDGRPSVLAAVRKQSGANTVEVADAVRAKLADLTRQYPDLTVATAIDQSTYTREALDDLQRSLVIGAILASLVVLAFFRDVRNTLVTVAGLPVIALGTVVVLSVLGVSLNMISMMAMSLSIGMLIDDAIVVRENIYRHVEQGEEPRAAAAQGTAEIAMAVIAVTSTIVAVFLPIAFTEGIAGKFLRDFGLTVAVAVLISLVEAFTLAPMLSATFFRSAERPREGSPVLAERYRRVLGWCLRHRAVVVLVAIASLIASGVVFAQLRLSFVPSSDLGEFTVALDLGPGARLAESDSAAQAVEHLLAADPNVEHVFTTIGGSDASTSQATVVVKLRARGQTESMIQQLRPRLRAALPNASFTIDAQSSSTTLGSSAAASAVRGRPIQLAIRGDDPAALDRVAADLERRLRQVPGIADVGRSSKDGAPGLAVVLDPTKAARDGLTPAQVGAALRALVSGESAGRIRVGSQDLDVVVRLDASERGSPSDLLRVPIVTARGTAIALADVGNLVPTTEPSQIDREDRQREVVVGANVVGRSQGAVLADAQNIAEKLPRPPGVTIETAGQARYANQMASALGLAMALSVLFVYMILASQFGSFVQPLVIMLALPFSFVGALLALFLAHFDFDMLAMIGLILLMGLVTKNSILLVDLANRLCRQGASASEAMLEAGPQRLRPILMTTVAMIGGMVPVALGLGAGAEVRRPMGISVIGGLLTSTLLTLVVVPVAYSLVADASALLTRVGIAAGRTGNGENRSILSRGIATWIIAFGLLATIIWRATVAPGDGSAPAPAPMVVTRATPTPHTLASVGLNPSPPAPMSSSAMSAPPAATRPVASSLQVGNTGGLGVNLRPTPGTAQAPITALPEGTRLQALGETMSSGGRDWVKVRDASGSVGWVARAYLVPANR